MVYRMTPEEAKLFFASERAVHAPNEKLLRELLTEEQEQTNGYWFWWMSEEGPWSVCTNAWIDPSGEQVRPPMRAIADAEDTRIAQLLCTFRNTVPALLEELDRLRIESTHFRKNEEALRLLLLEKDALVCDLESQKLLLQEELKEANDEVRGLRMLLAE